MRQGLSLLASSLVLGGLVFLGAGCETRGVGPGRDAGTMRDGQVIGPNGCTPGAAGFQCDGRTALECRADGTVGSTQDCSLTGGVCVVDLGCRLCRPNSFQCNGNNVERCNADGTAFEPFATCDAAAGQMCNPVAGACTSPCEEAASNNSYIGCEYWPVTTLNSQVASEFAPAVVVSNPQTMPANVSVTGPGGFSVNRTVAAGATETIELQWVSALRGTIGEEA